MRWTKVNKPLNKPVRFWFHKILLEFYHTLGNMQSYTYHSNRLYEIGYYKNGERFEKYQNIFRGEA